MPESQQTSELTTFFTGLRLVFFGTGDFAVPSLTRLVELGVRPLAVVTMPDSVFGRKQELAASPVKQAVQGLPVDAATPPIPLFQPQKLDDGFLHELKKHAPEVGILADYGMIVPQKVIDAFPKGIVNVHPSLLPKYRGASPVEASIVNGDAVSGVTLILIDTLLDHGPIIAQKKARMRIDETGRDVRTRFARLGRDVLIRTLPRYMAGKIVPRAQEHSEATITRMLDREEGKLSFAESATVLARKVRAFTPWPGTYAIWNTGAGEKRLKLLEAEAISQRTALQDEEPPCGTVIALNGAIGILTADGVLKVHKVQLEGKSPVSAGDFLNGYKDIVGSVLV